MNDLLKAADLLLAQLPFNGDKTTIGIAVHQLLPVAVAAFPPLAMAAPFISAASLAFAAFGLAHKGIKAVKAARSK